MPHRVEVAVGLLVAALVLTVDLRRDGFSSFAVLTYYAIAKRGALTLPGRRPGSCRRWSACGCPPLAVNLP